MSRGTATRLAVLSLIWGSSFLLIKIALEGLHPAYVSLGRIASGGAFIGVWVAVRRRAAAQPGPRLRDAAFLAVVGNMIPFTLIAFAETHITSALASILNATTPFMTAIAAAALLRHERLSAARAAGIAIGFCGVATIVLPGAGTQSATLRGGAMMIGAAASYGVSTAYARRFLRSDPATTTAAQLALATVGMGVVALVVAGGSPVQLTPSRVAAVLTLGVLGTGVGWAIYLRIVASERATTASLVTYLVPVISVVLGRVVLGESLRWTSYVGAAVVIAGIAVADGRLHARLQRPAAPSPQVDTVVSRGRPEGAHESN